VWPSAQEELDRVRREMEEANRALQARAYTRPHFLLNLSRFCHWTQQGPSSRGTESAHVELRSGRV